MGKQNSDGTNEQFIAGMVLIVCACVLMLYAIIWPADRLPVSIGGLIALAMGIVLTCHAYYLRDKYIRMYYESRAAILAEEEHSNRIDELVEQINNMLKEIGHSDYTAHPGSTIEIREEGSDAVSKIVSVDAAEHYLKVLEESGGNGNLSLRSLKKAEEKARYIKPKEVPKPGPHVPRYKPNDTIRLPYGGQVVLRRSPVLHGPAEATDYLGELEDKFMATRDPKRQLFAVIIELVDTNRKD